MIRPRYGSLSAFYMVPFSGTQGIQAGLPGRVPRRETGIGRRLIHFETLLDVLVWGVGVFIFHIFGYHVRILEVEFL